MILTKVHDERKKSKRSWTFIELLLLAPFGLLLWYVATQPLVLPEGSAPHVKPAAAAPVEPPVPAQEVTTAPAPAPDAQNTQSASAAPSDTVKPVFVTTGMTTVLERIAPVASVTIEVPEAVAAAEPAPVADTPAQAVTPTAAPVETVASTPPAAPPAEQKAAAGLRLEITDGTGAEGFARNVAQVLEQSGVTIAKTSSMPAGAQRRTVILFRDGFEEDARRLSKLFSRPPALVNNTQSRSRSDTSDVRLILGRAAVREKDLLAAKGGMPKS